MMAPSLIGRDCFFARDHSELANLLKRNMEIEHEIPSVIDADYLEAHDIDVIPGTILGFCLDRHGDLMCAVQMRDEPQLVSSDRHFYQIYTIPFEYVLLD